MFTPIKKSLQILTICTPIGTEDVRLVGDRIVGRWQQRITEWSGLKGRLLLEDFLNWPTDSEAIVRFTQQYAPVLKDVWADFRVAPLPKGTPMKEFTLQGKELPAPVWKPAEVQEPNPGKEFQFPLEWWRESQRVFRQLWEAVANKSQSASLSHRPLDDTIIMRDGKLLYSTGDLQSFFIMEFLSAPQERLRKCRRPDCESPYFVARHLRQQYCSPRCAEWAQAKAKKMWWSSEGKEWLNARKKRTRRKKSQTRG